MASYALFHAFLGVCESVKGVVNALFSTMHIEIPL